MRRMKTSRESQGLVIATVRGEDMQQGGCAVARQEHPGISSLSHFVSLLLQEKHI